MSAGGDADLGDIVAVDCRWSPVPTDQGIRDKDALAGLVHHWPSPYRPTPGATVEVRRLSDGLKTSLVMVFGRSSPRRPPRNHRPEERLLDVAGLPGGPAGMMLVMVGKPGPRARVAHRPWRRRAPNESPVTLSHGRCCLLSGGPPMNVTCVT